LDAGAFLITSALPQKPSPAAANNNGHRLSTTLKLPNPYAAAVASKSTKNAIQIATHKKILTLFHTTTFWL
jgi:hypothetical protein